MSQGRRINLARPGACALMSFALVAVLTPVAYVALVSAPLPGTHPVEVAYATPLEDCDLNGYDDHTDQPLPWAGFDSTRGDTIPPGWDGVANSWTGAHTNSGSAATSGGTKSSSSGSSGNSSSSNGSNSNSSNQSSSKSSSSGAQSSGSSGSTTAGTTTTAASGKAAGGTAASTAAASQPVTKTVVVTETVQAAAPSRATILKTIGTLKVSEAEGVPIHVGGTVNVSGQGFAAYADGLYLTIDNDTEKLDTVSTDQNGAFQTTIDIPDRFSAGVHHVTVGYAGGVISHTPVTFGAPTADSFAKALFVGFGDGNPERNVGLLTLAGMALLGSLAWGWQVAWAKAAALRRATVAPTTAEASAID